MSQIVGLSIPSHSTRSTPSTHVVYRIAVTTPSSSYEIHRRHRQFVALDSALRSTCAIQPPIAYPAYSVSFANVVPAHYAFLDDKFLNKRRQALEKYLRSIAIHGGKVKDVWTNSKAWKDFFAPDTVTETETELVIKESSVPRPRILAKGLPFRGANSYYLWALNNPDRGDVLDALQGAGIAVIRIFIAHVNANNKGSNNPDVPDLEPSQLGSYDDTILELIDQLMLDCSTRNIQLIIACHDRYALGWWDTDEYALTYGIVSPGTSGEQNVVDASVFYTSNACMTYFDHRIDHILAHENSLMGNVAWGANPGGVIYAIEPENEPYGHMSSIPSQSWLNDRAGRIKQNLVSGSGIVVTNGGGVDLATSTTTMNLSMANVDVVCVHDYSTDVWDTLPQVSDAKGTAASYGKDLIFEEWGADGSGKTSAVYSFVEACYDYNIAPLIWEVVKPGQNDNNYEIWTTDSDGAWNAYIHTPTGN